MTAFVIATAAMALLVLGWVLRPLWRDSRAAGVGMFASMAVVAGLLYVLVGTPRALDPAQRRAPETLADAVGRLQAELQRNPAQPEGWRLLARAHAAQGRLGEARDALARAVKLTPDDADLLTEASEARARAHPERRFDEQAVAMVRHALAVQPAHQRARWFLGIAQRQAGEAAEAARTWEPLLAVVDASTVASLRAEIDAARTEAGLARLPAAASAPVLLRVTVELAPELETQVGRDATLFVIARAPGTTMPVAAKRVTASAFPVTVELGDGDSPMPTAKLSQAGTVEVLARIARSGDAARATGDFESVPKTATPKAGSQQTLRVDRVVE